MSTTTAAQPTADHAVGDIRKLLPAPRDAWYVAAWDHEVTRTPLARTVLDTPLALYRTADGAAVALADACWHRLAPLSMGTLVGADCIRCPYHGIVYDSTGRCVSMPAQETINPSAIVRSFPVVERDRFVWVWVGDPEAADPDRVPDMHFNDDPEWAGDGKVIELDCNFQLVLDNLMDLTHEEFVHSGSIGTDALSTAEFDTIHDENTVTLTRWMENIEGPPFMLALLRERFPDFDGTVDRWQILHYEAPSTICIDVGIARAGTGARAGDRSQGINGWVLNTITPVGHRSCRYFWAYVRNYHTQSQRLTTLTREGTAAVFAQDEAMLAAQQRAIDANPEHRFYSLNIDVGGMWIRRLLERRLAAEGRAPVDVAGSPAPALTSTV